jgi:TM2 domain-containing membrane protein YozV
MPIYKYCRHCSAELNSGAAFCQKCGAPAGKGNHYCWNCGKSTAEEAVVCVNCGVQLREFNSGAAYGDDRKSKIAAGVLGILLGSLGIHDFYLGYNGKGAAHLVLFFLGFPTFGITSAVSAIWGLVDGILILTGSIKTDASGKPLRD